MNCNETRPLLHAYHDGELDMMNSLAIEQHLKDCAACEKARNSLQSLRAALRRSDHLAYRAPNNLRARVIREIAGPEVSERPRRNAGSFWPWLAFGATAFAVLTLLLRPAGISEHGQLVNEAVAGHVRSLMAEHLTDVVSSDQHTVKPWFNGKLDFAPDVKDFSEQGFPLAGGRLDYLGGRQVAALVYRHNKHFINVFVWPATTANAGQTENLRGYSVINRDANGFHYCLVSDLNEKELGDLADLLGK